MVVFIHKPVFAELAEMRRRRRERDWLASTTRDQDLPLTP